MTQVAARIATCVPAGTGPLGKTEMAGPANRCLREDGVTTGDVVWMTAYVSDQPLAASAGAGANTGLSTDAFVGAALVAIVAIGWIAGAQR